MTTYRYRGRLGEPRSKHEAIAQWFYRWRSEIILVYIILACAAAVILAAR